MAYSEYHFILSMWNLKLYEYVEFIVCSISFLFKAALICM